jgi:hypothetical protein
MLMLGARGASLSVAQIGISTVPFWAIFKKYESFESELKFN